MGRDTILFEIEKLKKYYPVGRGLKNFFQSKKQVVKAIDNISLHIKKGEILGIAGESGSGKTTIGEILVRLQEPSEGAIYFEGKIYNQLSRKEEKAFRRQVQMIFQDPYETLNPNFTIYDSIAEPLKIHWLKDKQQLRKKVIEALELAELKPPQEYMERYPHELSGGQRQRVAIARGIVLQPRFLVADEPVSMLDVSIRAGILNLLRNLRKQMDLTMVYISHDLSTIKYLCDRIAIMYLGKIVEIGNVHDVITNPQHPYTKTLLSAVPIIDPDIQRKRMEVDDEVPDQINLPEGCRFRPRCPFAEDICKTCNHELQEVATKQWSACLFDEKYFSRKERNINQI